MPKGYKTNAQCKGLLTFEECELTILRSAVDKVEKMQGAKSATSDEIKKMILIVETFIRRKRLICYGGTAINNILPKQSQFYNKELEIPDYDFFSANALLDTKELCNIFAQEGFEEVEGKSGQHHGTYKVFVNFIPIADITMIPKEIFKALSEESIRVGGLSYAPANFLRMSMYLELSRPNGDTSRWEKVLKRLSLLNSYYPLKATNCDSVDFQRLMENEDQMNEIYDNVKQTLVDQSVVFFGGYALTQYSKYMPTEYQHKIKQIPDFDVFTENPQLVAEIVKERLEDIHIKNVKIIRHDAIGELVAANYEVRIGKDMICFIYEPLACHSYNVVQEKGYKINIATIDTILSFYLAFIYIKRPYYSVERLLCMAAFLFEVQQKNRLEQRGLLKRFSIECIGHQETVEEMRANKSEKYKELKGKQGTPEYDEYFMRYRPNDSNKPISNKTKSNKSNKREREKKQTKTKKTNRMGIRSGKNFSRFFK
jgi:hypothetical protein